MESNFDSVWFLTFQAGALFLTLLPVLTVAVAIVWFIKWRRHARILEESMERLLAEIANLRDGQRTG